jgi:hypothetical protein
MFAAWATAAGLPAQCRLHGLKKAGMNAGIKAGWTPHETMSQTGHRTLSMVQLYTEQVEKAQVADNATAKLLARRVPRGKRKGNGKSTNARTAVLQTPKKSTA